MAKTTATRDNPVFLNDTSIIPIEVQRAQRPLIDLYEGAPTPLVDLGGCSLEHKSGNYMIQASAGRYLLDIEYLAARARGMEAKESREGVLFLGSMSILQRGIGESKGVFNLRTKGKILVAERLDEVWRGPFGLKYLILREASGMVNQGRRIEGIARGYEIQAEREVA